MKNPPRSLLVLSLALLATVLWSADEPDPAEPSTLVKNGLQVRRDIQNAAENAANVAVRCIVAIVQAGDVAFWQRRGNTARRTLRQITDLVSLADSVNNQWIGATDRAHLARWTANPDGTVTVTPP